MPVTILRWHSGSAGDTVLKMLLNSNSNMISQVRFTDMSNDRSVDVEDPNFFTGFQYQQLKNITGVHKFVVNNEDLQYELAHLKSTAANIHYIVKSHYYNALLDNTIDIVINDSFLPFSVKASLAKMTREQGQMIDYNELDRKIKDKKILYYYDCYNLALDRLRPNIYSKQQIDVKSILSGWESLTQALKTVNLSISENNRQYYDVWLEKNQKYIPSENYINLVESGNYDYTGPCLSIEEKYCLLALAKEHFRILPET